MVVVELVTTSLLPGVDADGVVILSSVGIGVGVVIAVAVALPGANVVLAGVDGASAVGAAVMDGPGDGSHLQKRDS